MLTDTFLGRCLAWRAPTDRDHQRFPSEPIAADAVPQPLPRHARPIDATRIAAPGEAAQQAPHLAAFLEATGTTSFLLARDGEIVCEWFAPRQGPATIARNLAVTKSVAALLVGQAIGDGRIPGGETRIGELVPGLRDPAVRGLHVDQLLRMASGIRYREGTLPWSDDARIHHGTHLRRAALRVRVADRVDRFFHDNDWHPLLIALALERTGGCSVARLIERDLWRPIGAGPASMTLDHAGDDALAHLESGLNCSAEDLVRIGQLVLQKGRWDERQVVPAGWLARLMDTGHSWRAVADFRYYRDRPWGRALVGGRYGYKDFWWHHFPRTGVHDVFAMGALGAHLYVSPDTRIVIVRQASRFPHGLWWAGLLRELAERFAGE
jgi:CubicO group peptidase (beta-lactamase class C family)